MRGIAASWLALALVLGACSGKSAPGAVTAADPPELRADYDLFVHRCSKCHSLSRPLESGIDSDVEWAMYVARMRRQPGSGISEQDSVAILRYLHVLVQRQRAAKAASEAPK